MPRLRAELQPDKIASVRRDGYHASFPLAAPQFVSAGQFSGVIPATSSSRVHVRHTGRRTNPPSSRTSSSNLSPSLTLVRSKMLFGMRTARLLPHLEIVAVVFMFQPSCVYPDNIQLSSFCLFVFFIFRQQLIRHACGAFHGLIRKVCITLCHLWTFVGQEFLKRVQVNPAG